MRADFTSALNVERFNGLFSECQLLRLGTVLHAGNVEKKGNIKPSVKIKKRDNKNSFFTLSAQGGGLKTCECWDFWPDCSRRKIYSSNDKGVVHKTHTKFIYTNLKSYQQLSEIKYEKTVFFTRTRKFFALSWASFAQLNSRALYT